MTARVALMLLVLIAEASLAEEGLRIESRAKAERLSIRSGRAHILVINTVRNAVSPDGTPADSVVEPEKLQSRHEYDLCFDGDNLRLDDSGAVSILNVENYLWHGTSNQGENLAVDMKPRTDGLKRVPDLRVWGVACCPFSVLQNLKLADCLERADRVSDSTETIEEEGRKIAVVSILRSSGGRLTYWIDSERGWNVIRAESEGMAPRGGGKLVDRIDCRLREFNGVWFPEEVTFRRSLNDVVLFDDVSTATAVALNEPLSNQLFTLAGMQLPIGTYVHENPPPKGSDRFWDGERVESGGWEVKPLDQKHQSSVMLIVIIVNLVAGTVLISLFFLWRKKRPNSQ